MPISNDINKTKLTDWKNEPSLLDIEQHLTDSKPDHDRHVNDINRWLDNMFITGSAKVAPPKGNSRVVPKLIRKQAEWRYTSLSEPFLSTPDIYNVYPITAGDRKRAKQNGMVLNNQFNTKINKIEFIDGYVRDAVDTGTVIVEVGWETVEEEILTKKPIYEYREVSPEQAEPIAQQYAGMIDLQTQNPEEYMNYSTLGLDEALRMFVEQQIVVIPELVEEQEVRETVETKNQPTLEIVEGENIIVDPSCGGNIKKAGFVIKKFKSSLADLKKDGKYINLNKINIESSNPLAEPDFKQSVDNTSFNFNDKNRKQFVVYTYWGTWDTDGTGILKQIVFSWVGSTIIRCELNPFPFNHPPFVKAVYMPKRKSVYGEPDGELLEDNQKIIGAITRGMIDLMGKSANGQTGTRKDLLDVTNARKFRKGEDYEFNGTVDPRQAIYAHVYPEIPQSAYNMIEMQNNDAESLSGVKAFHTGISGKSISGTATGVRGTLDATSRREIGILRRLAYGIIQIGRMIISMNSQFLSDEEVIRITADEFVTIRRDDLEGKFDLQLTISTAEEDNAKAEELAFILQTNAAEMDRELQQMVLADILRLRKMPDLAKKIEDFKPTPDPMLVMEQELKIKLLEAQIAKEYALAGKHDANSELDGVRGFKEATQGELNTAKVDTERAKSRQIHSDSDRTDLDFLEQETGTHQERELEKIDRKAEKAKKPAQS